MRIRLIFDIDVSEVGMASYLKQYPDFKDENEAETLAREAIAQWDSEWLLADPTKDVHWEWSQP